MTRDLELVVAGLGLATVSGLPALLLRRTPQLAQRCATALLASGAAFGLVGAVSTALGGASAAWRGGWSAPFAALSLRLDPLAAVFLVPVFLVPAAGSVYGLAYFPQAERGARSVRLQLFYGVVTGAMALVVLASNAMLFAAAWELTGLCGFLLVLTEWERKDAQGAAFVYLAAGHVGALALFALLAVLGSAAGSFELTQVAQAGLPATTGVFLLMLLAFGIKAGLMPLHFWLPGAHGTAPSHVSALMSGVFLKLGIYGLVRVTSLFATPPAWWGLLLLALGALSAVLGVAFALAQHDLKRLLAYHSVENVGIIAMGIGIGLVGRSVGSPALVVLGFGGGLLHVVNHALFKALLFLGAGAVDHATGTREVDLLGGLGKRMPRTLALFLLGSVAISGLPPLNGFVSEWLVYLGSFHALSSQAPLVPWTSLAAPVLALVGGLAAACFAKVVGVVFLGAPRSAHGAHAHEAPPAMLAPMALLGAGCVAIGLFPAAVLPALRLATSAWSGLAPAALAEPVAEASASAGAITACATLLGVLVAGLATWRNRRVRHAGTSETWGCGFTRPTARMQYTGSSFAEMLTLRFGWAFFPRAAVKPPRGAFPQEAAFGSHVPDTVLDMAIVPLLRSLGWFAARARRLHQGTVQAQALLVGVALVALLAWRFLWW